MAMIKFLDYGGYLYVPASSLRVLRQDFMIIPFQAVEAFLDNVVPVDSMHALSPSPPTSILFPRSGRIHIWIQWISQIIDYWRMFSCNCDRLSLW